MVGSYHTRFSPKLNNDVYLEYEAFAKKRLVLYFLRLYRYSQNPLIGVTATIKVSGPTVLRCFMEIEPRFSIDKLTGADLSFGPF